MAEMIDFVELRCVGGGHNKFYSIWLEQNGTTEYFFVNFKYGAIGTAGLSGSKTSNSQTKQSAKGIYQKVVNEKLGKGYTVYKQGSKALPKSMLTAIAEKAKKKTMADYTSVGLMMPVKDDLKSLELYLKDDDWLLQQKLNGQFCRIYWDRESPGSPIAFNKTGGIMELSDEISGAIVKAGLSVTLDGELVDGSFHVVDAIDIGGQLLTAHSTEMRFDKIMEYVTSRQGKYVHAVKCADNESSKRLLVVHLQVTSQEGVVLKRKNRMYTAGKATSPANAVSVKIKFWKEVSAQLLKWNDKNSIQVGLLEKVSTSMKTVNVGNVPVPEKYKKQIKDAGEDCIVRVRYLYATAGNKLYQPTLDPDDDGMVIRDDQTKPDNVSDLVHEGDTKVIVEEPFRQITL